MTNGLINITLKRILKIIKIKDIQRNLKHNIKKTHIKT